jgi:transglutaminase-like putative cysteine protease
MDFLETGYPEPTEQYLRPTPFLDYDKPNVSEFAKKAIYGATTDKEKAVQAFYAVRDTIRYDPYRITNKAAAYSASDVLEIGSAYCIPKASLLAAVTRAAGIPTAIGLSDVTNHMCSPRMAEAMGGKTLFMHHGYAVMLIDGKWVKAAPAFNIELCDKFDVTPTEFDGDEDALLQEFDKNGRKHMEYVTSHGIWSDVPVQRVIDDFTEFYGQQLWERCQEAVEQNERKQARNFEDESPVT